MRTRLSRFLLVGAALVTFVISGGDSVRAVSSGVVISQVYGAGGNSGAVLKNDFIELFNRGASAVNLGGMSVQYASTAGSSWQVTALPAVNLAPGQYFLVQEGGGTNGAALPTADATGGISMAAGAGKVALSSTTTALTGVCPTGLVDFVGYGTGTNCFEGSAPTATISATLSVFRAAAGCTDTDSNNTDFATGTPSARNTATALSPCGGGGGGDTAPTVATTTPAANASGIATTAAIVINFSESVNASASAFSIECPAGSPKTFSQTASPASSFTLTPVSALPSGTTCSVKVTATQVTDTDGTADPMAADYSFSFATAAANSSSTVVISQVYGGGGNSGATYRNDYVELYNRSGTTVDLTGWSLQYASSTGSGWDSNKLPIGGTIGAGEYYLVSLASGGAIGASLPAANISGQINMAAGSGKIALVGSYTGLSGNCPVLDPNLRDLVGYGGADCGEGGTTAPGGSNTTAQFRKSNGATDTDNNASDFSPAAAPNPRRTAPIVELGPNVLASDPRSNGTNVPRDGTVQVTFTEPVSVDTGWFSLTCAVTGPHVSATFAESSGGLDHYITPNDNFVPGEQCSVTIFKNSIHDVDLDDAGINTDSLPADYTWSFTVATGTAPPYPSSVHLAFGNPSNAGTDPANYLMDKPEFTLSYNRDLGRPNWVSWHLSDEWVGSLTRVDTFRPDPQIPPDWYRVQSFDFSGSGFDRGHMTPNADRDKETSSPINQATFLMSNMVAQAPGNNQGPWASLETYLRTLLDTEHDEIYIVAGASGVGGVGSLGGVTNTLADGHVTVPAVTWKVALVLPKDAGDDLARVNCSTRTIAVIMPNQDNIRPNAWETYLTTVDAVEALTGYDFFSNLPEPYQRCVEAGTNGNNPGLVKGDQAITFAQPGDVTFGDASFAVAATGGASGNAVTFAASGACMSTGFFGSTITITGAGTCSVTASQAGSDIYNAAPDVTRTFTVNKATPIFSALSSPTIEATTAVVTVDGVLTAGGLVPNSIVTITINGHTLATQQAADGHFSATFATSLLSVSNSPYTITYEFAGSTNFVPASATSLLTVADTTAPTIDAHDDVFAEATEPGGALVNYTAPATHDAVSGDGVATCLPASGSLFALGATTVTCTATDGAGNTATSTTFVVTVRDTTGPTIEAHASVSAEATSANGATVTYDVPATHDLVEGAGVATCAPASGSVFALGTTTVTCTAQDSHHNSATPVSFTVTVGDATAPTIDAHAPVSVEATGATGAVVTYASPATHDGVDGDGVATCAPLSGSTFALGATTVTCTASDAAGNAATSTTFVVTVVDTTAPIIAAHDDLFVEATQPGGAVVTYTSPTTQDAVDGAGAAICTPASGSLFAVGATPVSCTAVDAAGNTVTTTVFTVTVRDTTGPVIAAHDAVTVEATSSTGATVTYTSPVANDVVEGDVPTTCFPASGSVFAMGSTSVTCLARDSRGNQAAPASFTVTVRDTTAPVIEAHASITVMSVNPLGTSVTYSSPATHDAVDGDGVASCTPVSGSVFALGTTTVTCRATDAAGNAAAPTTFTVTVGENRLGRFVVLGREQAWLREGSQVSTGDVGAASAMAAPRGRRDRDDDGERDNTVEVRLGENVKMLQAGSRVVGDTVWMRNRSQVFDVLYNELENRRGTILGAQTHPVTLPYVGLPAALTVDAGTQSVTVARNATLTLAPGRYGRVQVREKGTLILTGGRYDFVSLDVDQSATVLFRSATDLRIKTELDTDNKSKLIVDQSVVGLSAANVLITVLGGDNDCRHDGHGSDGDDAGQTVAHIGEGNTITANIYAPNGTLWIRAKTVATGAFIGARVRVGERVTLTLDSYYR